MPGFDPRIQSHVCRLILAQELWESRFHEPEDKPPTWFISLEIGRKTLDDKNAVQRMQARHEPGAGKQSRHGDWALKRVPAGTMLTSYGQNQSIGYR